MYPFFFDKYCLCTWDSFCYYFNLFAFEVIYSITTFNFFLSLGSKTKMILFLVVKFARKSFGDG